MVLLLESWVKEERRRRREERSRECKKKERNRQIYDKCKCSSSSVNAELKLRQAVGSEVTVLVWGQRVRSETEGGRERERGTNLHKKKSVNDIKR